MDTQQARQIANVLEVAPEQLRGEALETAAATGVFDLIVFDRCSPAEMPHANTLFIDALPPGNARSAEDNDVAPYIIDVDQIHPLTQLVDMSNVKIVKGRTLDPPLGSTVLFDSVTGPLFVVTPRGSYQDAVLGFSLLREQEDQIVPNTTWPLRQSFPVFVFNTLRYLGLGGYRGFLKAANLQPGDPVTIRPRTDIDQVTIVNPLEARLEPVRSGNRALVAADTEIPGIYDVYEQGADKPTSHFAVNLFSQAESNIMPAASLELGDEQVGRVTESRTTRRELWKLLLLAALLLLIFEWYVFNRRVYL